VTSVRRNPAAGVGAATVTGSRIDVKRSIVLRSTKNQGECVWMKTKPAFPALRAPMSLAWVHGSLHVEDFALPKSLKSGNFTLAKAIIRWNVG